MAKTDRQVKADSSALETQRHEARIVGSLPVSLRKSDPLHQYHAGLDYLKWKPHDSHSHVSKTSNAKHIMKDCLGQCLPKTYSMRVGALVLYSEKLAEPSKMGSSRMHLWGHRYGRKLQMKLHTLQDLHKAIMAYGGKQPYLQFLNKPDNHTDQNHPGHLAKRYLFRLSTWDPNIYRLQCAGQ
ncbi:LOW QUALITY PROTEIN: uncharacterized protein KIAA2012 homolog [Mergus octosetaceus]